METIPIGKKSIPNYLLAITKSEDDEIEIVARGQLISKAVDIVEIAKRTHQLKQKKISINSVILKDKNNGNERRVSQINIVLQKPK